MIGEAMLLVVREAISRSGAVNCFVTLGLHSTWRPGTVFGSDLSKGHTATARANALFKCVSGACLVLKVCALPEHSRGAEWAAERINRTSCPHPCGAY